MRRAQGILPILGATGFLHSSMVPPVQQGEQPVCRYHEFLGRGWPLTRGCGVTEADLVPCCRSSA